MKKWTVMLIPHDRGNTRSLSLYSFQLWFVVAALVSLSFTSAFLYQRQAVAANEAERLRQAARHLEQALGNTPKPVVLSDQERAEIERRVRAEYDARDAALTAELGELYDLEAHLRQIHSMPPRITSYAPDTVGKGGGTRQDPDGGKGGPPGGLASDYVAVSLSRLRPPQIIYGMSRPSADVIVQEINLRSRSLNDLLAAMAVEKERIARMPAWWPSLSPASKISSSFGFRKDPFSYDLRHHDGTDITAPYGSAIVATAKGKVSFAGWDGDLGYIVRIDHGDGIETGYGHMSEVLVREGATVDRGQIIGKVGSTGRSTGNHIHYEVRINGRPVNPEPYLGLGN